MEFVIFKLGVRFSYVSPTKLIIFKESPILMAFQSHPLLTLLLL